MAKKKVKKKAVKKQVKKVKQEKPYSWMLGKESTDTKLDKIIKLLDKIASKL